MDAGAGLHYRTDGAIAEIRLDSPPVNALTAALLDGLLSALATAAADDRVRAVLITSAVPGRFCAGLDLRAAVDGPEDTVPGLLDRLYVRLFDAQAALGKPSIAAVGGAARGGGVTLAISCDVILAGQSATFGYPEIDIGVLPAIHFHHLPGIVGRHRAFELLFTGRPFDADEAAALGLASRVVADDRLADEARALAETFAAKPPGAVRRGRAAFRQANDLARGGRLKEAVEIFCEIAATDEARQAIRAFLERRSPDRRT